MVGYFRKFMDMNVTFYSWVLEGWILEFSTFWTFRRRFSQSLRLTFDHCNVFRIFYVFFAIGTHYNTCKHEKTRETI